MTQTHKFNLLGEPVKSDASDCFLLEDSIGQITVRSYLLGPDGDGVIPVFEVDGEELEEKMLEYLREENPEVADALDNGLFGIPIELSRYFLRLLAYNVEYVDSEGQPRFNDGFGDIADDFREHVVAAFNGEALPDMSSFVEYAELLSTLQKTWP